MAGADRSVDSNLSAPIFMNTKKTSSGAVNEKIYQKMIKMKVGKVRRPNRDDPQE